jgi:hypothetical protein
LKINHLATLVWKPITGDRYSEHVDEGIDSDKLDACITHLKKTFYAPKN